MDPILWDFRSSQGLFERTSGTTPDKVSLPNARGCSRRLLAG